MSAVSSSDVSNATLDFVGSDVPLGESGSRGDVMRGDSPAVELFLDMLESMVLSW